MSDQGEGCLRNPRNKGISKKVWSTGPNVAKRTGKLRFKNSALMMKLQGV